LPFKKFEIIDFEIAGSLSRLLYCTIRKFTATRGVAGKTVKTEKKSETFDTKFFNFLWVKLLFILFSFRGYDSVSGNLVSVFQKIKEYWINFKAIPFLAFTQATD